MENYRYEMNRSALNKLDLQKEGDTSANLAEGESFNSPARSLHPELLQEKFTISLKVHNVSLEDTLDTPGDLHSKKGADSKYAAFVPIMSFKVDSIIFEELLVTDILNSRYFLNPFLRGKFNLRALESINLCCQCSKFFLRYQGSNRFCDKSCANANNAKNNPPKGLNF